MDERHWWIAGKIQESFKIGGYENPSLLEDFMCEESTLGIVNRFLKAGGPCRLFFYCQNRDSGVLSTNELYVTGNLAALKDSDLEKITVLYFLRNHADKDVDPNHMERNIFCGELKHNTIEALGSLLSDVYIPLLRAQKDWGQCNDEEQSHLMHSMDKFVIALNETAATMRHSRQWILRQPENITLNDFKQQRAASLDPRFIGQYEELVTEWINPIESILFDMSDERFMDPSAGPMSELERWRRRQRLLISLTEQLKGKECKAVIAILIQAKSRLLKKWKATDAVLTDGLNDTKDKVKYLESLKRHFDHLYNDATPYTIINTALPGLTNSIKQMDSISRYYARTGFLGIFMAKVTNQLVTACKDHIKSCTINTVEETDNLWDCVQQEVLMRDPTNTVDPQQKLLKSQVESKLKHSTRGSKGHEGNNIDVLEDGLLNRLRACLTLQSFYREALHSLRDSLGGSQNLSHFSSVSSFSQTTGPGLKVRTTTGGGVTSRLPGGTFSPSKRLETLGHGVPITDEDAIMSHMDVFCSRIRKLLEVISTIAQYKKLQQTVTGIPRPRKEDLVTDDGSDQDEYAKFKKQKESKPPDNRDDHPLFMITSNDRSLGAIAEENTKEIEKDIDEDMKDDVAAMNAKQSDEVYEVTNTKQGLTEDELSILRKYYPEDEEEEGPGVSAIVESHLKDMEGCMRGNVSTKTMLDVESKDKNRFDEHYSAFQGKAQELEAFLAAYLHAVFVRRMKTQIALDIITKFAPVLNRTGIKATVTDKYVEIFNWYEADLEEVQQIYECHKANPQLVRNAPPVAGAIYWSRQLLKRIEEPMKLFRDIKAVTQLADFGRIVRMYNRLATALVTFESLWFTQWKNHISQAQAGLRATLFVHHPITREIVVNADERVLELIHEAKWLTRLDIAIPESAQSVLEQEARFKKYRAHLELVLSEYSLVCQQVPHHLKPLFQPHINNVHQQLQPGLSTLAWNSMNIDAFLHQIHSATDKLKKMGQQATHIMDTQVLEMISKISSFYLYDLNTAFSKTWLAQEFWEVMCASIQEHSQQLKAYISTVVEALQRVANLLSVKKDYTILLRSMINAKSTILTKLRQSKTKADTGKSLKDKKMAAILDNDEKEHERQLAEREEELVMDLISHYKDKIYEALLSCTTRSLAALSEATGCTGEIVRTLSPLSSHGDHSPLYGDHGSDSEDRSSSPQDESHLNSAHSRLTSAQSDRAASNVSNLSDMTWSLEHKPMEPTYLQFEVQIKFSIPNIIVEPTLDLVQNVITNVSNAILESVSDIAWLSKEGEESLYIQLAGDGSIQELQFQLSNAINELSGYVNRHLFHLSYYNFLWKDDMHGNFKEFIMADPGALAIKREVERYLYIEKKILGIPSNLPVGPVCLYSDPIKDALHGFAMTWKTTFASVLHEEAKKKLDAAVAYRTNVKGRLEQHVQTLDQLNSALHLLEELQDMENKIDGVYLPIETMYAKLREFELRLPRQEVELVDQLREQWMELLELAEQVRVILLKERRGAFEQELDKQVKTFVVEVIQFRNAFDAQGPSVPGIQPSEAVSRLQDFQLRYQIYDAKRKTLDSVSKLFGISGKPFPELERTGEELDLLSQLYGLFQKFIRFDSRFRDTLWAEVDLGGSSSEVESYWDECLALPSKLKDWDAYTDLKTKLQTYLEVFPLLQSLASKGKHNKFNLPEIRNRHWLQVMQVTNSSFQLEANVFKLCHLLDIGLIKHKTEVEEICLGASQELELETKMRMTEEEWTEQVLNFEHYKRRGPMYLDKAFTQRLLEQLEDAEALLATMLTSKYIGPLRDETATWAEKLKEVAEVLELWLEVQDLWQYLEAVFSNSIAVRELPQEAKRFARIDKGWTKMMKRAFDTRNVLQCCHGGEVPKAVVLRHIQEELEICFKSLVGYLDNKRRSFPRFYFVSDPVLLALLSHPNDLESVRPYLRSLFMQIHDVKLEKKHDSGLDDSGSDDIRDGHQGRSSRTPGLSPHDRGRAPSQMSSLQPRSTTPPIIDKRLHQHFKINPSVLQHAPSMLPSEGLVDDITEMDATAVLSADGEVLPLAEKVNLVDGVEVWLGKLRDSVGQTLQEMNLSVVNDCNSGIVMDEWAYKYPSQVCRLGMLYHWTGECETSIAEIKYDRKALQALLKKYQNTTSRLSTIFVRGAWRTFDEPMLPVHKVRLDCMITQSMYLRDVLENISTRKLRETTDFEWRRSIRCYMHPPAEEKCQEPMLWILDTPYQYGWEFYGADCGAALTPITERCFLSMSMALSRCLGVRITGPVGVGKTETIKGLANILGNFVGVFQCSSVFNPINIGKISQGIAMDGCWGCFDEGQMLSKDALAVLMDHIQAIISAMRAKQNFMYLVDGAEIPIKKNVGLFMTSNPTHSLPEAGVPHDIVGSFRTVSLVKPDIGQILKAKCSALGFRAPNILALRLKVMSELVKDQLPQDYQHFFSAWVLGSVLKRASQKRRSLRDDRLSDREKRDDPSRCDSANSEVPPTRLTTHGSSLGVGSKQPGQMNMRKGGTPNPMTAAGKLEHAIVFQTIEEMISPRLSGEDLSIFRTIVKDCFVGLPDPPTTVSSAKSRTIDIESAIESKAQSLGHIAHKPWIAKCMQLYNLSQVHHGIIVAGKSGTGKSTCIETVVEALCVQARGMSRQSHASKSSVASENMHKLQRIYPLMVDDLSLMFGSLSHGDWVDGIVTSAIRKANRNQSTTWLCLDGQLTPAWVDNFNSILSSEKVLHQLNGDKLFLSDNVIVLFETDSLTNASPSAVARSGILFMDQDTIGWKPMAEAWLESRTHQEVHWDMDPMDKSLEGVLQRAFQKTLDPITNFVLHEAKPRLRLSEVGMFRTCLGLLSAMLADNIEIGGELHIERLYLFCLIWTYGGLLDAADRKAFSDLLTTLSTALPDDDRDICVFDYYVDESGEWDPWHSRVPETVFTDNQDLLGEVFIDTVDTIRTHILMEFAAASGQNVLLVGPRGAGKTALIDTIINAQDPQTSVCKRLVFSGASTATQLHQFVESNIFHRQGFVYGAKENKKLKVFIDDINLPSAQQDGVQRCNELLRQLLDNKVLCTLQKPFELQIVEGLTVFSAMALADHPSVSNRVLTERLRRHFAVFSLPAAQGEPLKSVVHGILEANMTQHESPGLDLDLHNALVRMSCDMLLAVQSVLKPTPVSGRHHYLFTLKDISKCFQCLKRLPDESKADETMVISLWRHEIMRIMRDRISRSTDLLWFDDKLHQVFSQHWSKLEEKFAEYFVTFPTDARIYQRPLTTHGTKQVKVMLQPVENLGDLHTCLNTHLTRYNEEFGNVRLDIMLSDFTIAHVVRMHRILSFHHGGNMLLIGAVGSHLSRLCRLALHVADIPIHKIDTSKQSNFFDGLRSAIRLSGSEGKIITLLCTARDLNDPVYLDAINSLLISGEYPHLFSNDEIDGLLQAIHPAMKREFPSSSIDPMKFFVSRVKSNLHIIVCLQPSHPLLKSAYNMYPGLLSGCQMNWFCDWPQEALMGEASYFIAKHQLTQEFENLRDSITTCLANIHSFMLRDCKQLPWAGDLSPEITLSTVKVHDRKKDQVKVQTSKVPNLPYSKTILHERIKQRHRNTKILASNEVYVGPNTYRRFMDCFKYLYVTKSQQRTESVEQLKKVLTTLDKTRADAKVMKKAIKTITGNFEEAAARTADLLQRLTNKATVLEKLKAKVGLSKSLDAYLHLTEFEVEEVEEDELLKAEEYDDYDKEFDKMREATLKTRQVQAKEEYADAQKRVDECRQQLEYARSQVYVWKSKVDRQCIERLKAFQTPPVLVGQVMEMVMILIGKRLPSQRIQEVRENPGKEDLSSRMSSSSSSTKILVKKTKPTKDGDRFDRSQWKSMQLTMNDSLKFVDMLHNVSWEDGLPHDVLQAVESYLAISPDGQLGVTGEGSMLENASDKTFQATKQSIQVAQGRPSGITISAAKYSSEDCATLVQYTIAIVEYTRRCLPLKTATERMNELEREIEENERQQKQAEQEALLREKLKKRSHSKNKKPKKEEKKEEEEMEEELSEVDLPRIQEEVNQLQQEFDQSVVEKHSLQMELQSMNERLKAASELVDSLKDQEAGWRQQAKDNGSNELLLANCLAAAGFLTYCGAVNIDTRLRIGEFFMQVCEHHGLPLHKKLLFRNMELFEFLYTPLNVMKLQMIRLPTTKLMLENSCFLMQEESTTAWPLICDPTSRVLTWLRGLYKERELVEVKYHEIRSQLENCLADGIPLLVTDCDVNQLVSDLRFVDVIQSCVCFIKGKCRFKVIVTDHEVECDPKFRLFLHTTSEPQTVPHQLAAYTSTLFYQQSRQCIEEELLDTFMVQEKARLENESSALRQEKEENMLMSERLERHMRDKLSSDVRLMNDLQATRRLAELKKQYDETQENLARIATGENSIFKAREGFRVIAQRAAICFDTTQYMREINPLYQTSFNQFEELFKAAISHSDRLAVKALIDKLTFSAYTTTARSLLERDRLLYSLLLAIEVEDSLNNLGPGERDFLVSPNYSSVVMSSLGSIQPPDSRIVQAKKPFDWMTEDQFHNLQVLATHFEWFQEMFDRMPKDGRETQWRNLCESDSPELQSLPDKMDEVYKPMQRLCVVRAVRSDRLIQASCIFIGSVLGKKYIGDVAPDFPTLLRQSSPTIPIILLSDNELDTAVRLFTDFANRKQNRHTEIFLTDNSIILERVVRKQIQKGMAEGQWVFLHNAHNCPHLLNSVETLLAESLPASSQTDQTFRLWITMKALADGIPVRLLQNSIKAVISLPKVMKDSLCRSMSWMEPDILKQSNRAEWPVMLHNLCYLHAAIRLRARFGQGGWNCPADFANISFRELQESVNFTVGEFKDPLFVTGADGTQVPRVTSWTGIRYILAEVVYGSHITDPVDQQSLSAMVDYWVSPTAIKKEFEVARLKYRHPTTFFNPNVRLNTLIQALDGIGNLFLDVPEGCHLHPNVETLLGDDQYIFTRLNRIFDVMPSTPTLSHKLFPRPPTPFIGPPLAGISYQSNNPSVVEQGLFSTASYATYKMRKDVELWEICYNMLQRVPKSYNKEYIVERVKKIGGFTTFNNFIMKELETMYKLLSEIRSSLQAIKVATESNALGDQMSDHTLSVADDLFHLRIPQLWCDMSGFSAPPLTWGLGQWLAELQSRCHHFERILSLGRERMPFYWLGAFFNPRGLLALIKQESIRNFAGDRSGYFEQFVFQTEVTARDKDHLRDPPQEGMFVHGIYIWGCTWEKTTGELQDSPPRTSCAALPVVHLTCWPAGEKPIVQDSTRATETYQCPVYHSRIAPREVVMEMDVRRDGIPATRWALRGLSATIRPY
ncbi:LOW QUALITY PROTEIN: dynein gamma chain, flagellar outer arm-like [Pomacea canaliculata]|uniref:LOW QUALITY PROTEIN: dynein gamma chain, flagellar outer arm-like n=1 Tax=Pomacea canaliculata TaxID=400727 RepID=UPI000D73399B|nr:LOW QUALITY PROTEIN: dynein gamma chain, flagellar outer arm-like [Pomacea canaliculata]